MPQIDRRAPPIGFGDWRDAEALRRWSFARRTVQQRLDWLVAALTVRYEAADARLAAKRADDHDATRDEFDTQTSTPDRCDD